MEENSLFSQFRKLKLKQALSEIEKIQKKLERELNQPGKIFESYELVTGQRRAKEIMGKNMISVEDAAQVFGVEFSIKQLNQLFQSTYYEKTLQNFKDTHILFPGYPISIYELSYKKPHLIGYNRECREGFWYDYKDLIYKDTPKCRWYLVKKDLIFDNPRPQINDDEEMLSPVEIIYMLVLYQQVTQSRLFSNTYIRCIKKDYRLGEEVMSNAYIDTSKGVINIFHPFNHQAVSPQAIVICQKPSLWH